MSTFFFCFWEQVESTPRTLARCGVSYPDCVVVVFKVSVVFVIFGFSRVFLLFVGWCFVCLVSVGLFLVFRCFSPLLDWLCLVVLISFCNSFNCFFCYCFLFHFCRISVLCCFAHDRCVCEMETNLSVMAVVNLFARQLPECLKPLRSKFR